MRCESCKLDYESDAKYCRMCGSLLNASPQHPAKELPAQRNAPVETVKLNSTSLVGVNFSNPPSPKQVKPLQQEGGDRTAKSRRRQRGSRNALWTATAVVLLLASAVAAFVFVRGYTRQPHVTTPARVAALYVIEKAIVESDKELANKTRVSKELDEKVAEKQQHIKELDVESADKERSLEKLQIKLAAAESKLDEFNVELASKESRRDQLNREISYARRTLKENKKEIAKLAPKMAEVARLNQRINVLRKQASQKEFTVRNLQQRIDRMTNANHASVNRRTPRKR